MLVGLVFANASMPPPRFPSRTNNAEELFLTGDLGQKKRPQLRGRGGTWGRSGAGATGEMRYSGAHTNAGHSRRKVCTFPCLSYARKFSFSPNRFSPEIRQAFVGLRQRRIFLPRIATYGQATCCRLLPAS